MEKADTTKSFFELNQEPEKEKESSAPPADETTRKRKKSGGSSVDMNALDYEGNESDKEKVN